MPQMQDQSLNLLTCVPSHYHYYCVKAAKRKTTRRRKRRRKGGKNDDEEGKEEEEEEEGEEGKKKDEEEKEKEEEEVSPQIGEGAKGAEGADKGANQQPAPSMPPSLETSTVEASTLGRLYFLTINPRTAVC